MKGEWTMSDVNKIPEGSCPHLLPRPGRSTLLCPG